MARPLISLRNTWANFERRILEILRLALQMLQEQTPYPIEENDINHQLSIYLRRANYTLRREDRGLDSNPFYEARNQPDSISRTNRDDKRPDFQWEFVDYLESDPDKSSKHYVIECKRLGLPSSPTWKLNKNYITDGVLRFIEAEWGYGKFCSSSAMVGYVQNMNLSDILGEINQIAADKQIPTINPNVEGLKDNDISQLEHQIDRQQILPRTFKLNHLWVDLR